MPAHETYPADMSYYSAEDAAMRERTVAQVGELSWRPGFARPAACNGTILMMDDRRPENHTPSSALFADAASVRYYHKTFALNYLYAQRHGLEFRLVRPTRGPWLSSCVCALREDPSPTLRLPFAYPSPTRLPFTAHVDMQPACSRAPTHPPRKRKDASGPAAA